MSEVDLDYESLWRKLNAAIESCEKSGVNEYIVYTKLRPRRRNRIEMHDDYFRRLSDQDKSVWQTIPKENVLLYAKMAVEAGNTGFSMRGFMNARMGSIKCVMLDLLDEFEYRPGRFFFTEKIVRNTLVRSFAAVV